MTNNELWNRYEYYMHIQGPPSSQWECATICFVSFFGVFFVSFEFLVAACLYSWKRII